MKERPILFSAPMVQAILAGHKSQTRRLIKPQPTPDSVSGYVFWKDTSYDIHTFPKHDSFIEACPQGKAGDRLWVKETFMVHTLDVKRGVIYRADIDHCGQCPAQTVDGLLYVTPKDDWIPSIFMPRLMSRITLRITEVRAERLNEISDVDVYDEGLVDCFRYDIDGQPWIGVGKAEPPRIKAFSGLWDSINGKTFPWSKNPWVWVVGFEVVE